MLPHNVMFRIQTHRIRIQTKVFFPPKTFLDLHKGLQEKPPALQRVLFSMKLLKTDSNPDPGSLAQLNLDPDPRN
jgi:hypothetical protein